MLRSYLTCVHWCTQIKGKAQIRVVIKLCMAINSGKMSISYFTENKGVLLTLTVKKMLLLLRLTDFIEFKKA